METMLASLPEQYRWAADLTTPSLPAATGALVCGMGGSGIAGDVAAAVAGEAPVFAHKSYGIPGWAERLSPLVVAVSYSGNTEETLSGVEAAERAGLAIAAVSSGGVLSRLAREHDWPLVEVPGGLQPRAAFGYLTGAVMRILEGAGLVEGTGLTEAAIVTDELLGADLDGPGRHLADDLAEGLAGRITLIVGSGPAAVAAYRWKTQINENAKAPAFTTTIPETDHNEIVGWSALGSVLRRTVGVIALRDPHEPSRVAARFDPTLGRLAEGAGIVGEVWAQGEHPLARMASLSAIGDMVSLRLARNAAVDPVPVEAIEILKQELGET
ncbi:MAG: bifunctional phosphoglucose/phosphomannose isomerase [Gammaproteobacteria bacterium]|nr:bifunctional phosphoglucose/phosphomannose isomerase [Gammaproteobacteria bacterium]